MKLSTAAKVHLAVGLLEIYHISPEDYVKIVNGDFENVKLIKKNFLTNLYFKIKSIFSRKSEQNHEA